MDNTNIIRGLKYLRCIIVIAFIAIGLWLQIHFGLQSIQLKIHFYLSVGLIILTNFFIAFKTKKKYTYIYWQLIAYLVFVIVDIFLFL